MGVYMQYYTRQAGAARIFQRNRPSETGTSEHFIHEAACFSFASTRNARLYTKMDCKEREAKKVENISIGSLPLPRSKS